MGQSSTFHQHRSTGLVRQWTAPLRGHTRLLYWVVLFDCFMHFSTQGDPFRAFYVSTEKARPQQCLMFVV